jgi:CheY-like chemotaxis protein
VTHDSDVDARRSELAHELRNPLAVISGYAELLRLRDDERTRLEAADRILEAVDQLSRALDAALDRFLPRDRPQPAGVKRVALVDDEEPLRTLLRATLLPSEYEVMEARTGEEALALFSREQPDLVVLDWKLPGRSGAEILQELKASRPDLPVIVLTADQRADAARADAFLIKPFSPLELLDLIERLLG